MRFFKILHFLSVDVVLGACLFQCLLTNIFLQGQFPPLFVILALAFTVWTIYLVDRMIDNQKPILDSPIHDFHRRHALSIKCLIVCNIIILTTIVINLPKYLIINGLFIACLVLAYWALLIYGFFDRIKFSKEISTAILYSLGIFLYVYLTECETPYMLLVLVTFLFFLLALQNLILFTLLANSGLKGDLIVRGIEGLFVCLWLAILYFTHISVFLLLPFLITFVIHVWIHYISRSKQWAWLGELAFFSPLFYYLYAIIST